MTLAKTIARILGWLRAAPCLARYRLLVILLGEQRAMTSVSERMAKIPGQLGIYARQVYYSDVLDSVGKNVYFGFMTLFSKQAATIGDRVYIGRMCTIGHAAIEDDVMIADGVQVLSGRHQHAPTDTDSGTDTNAPMRDNPHQYTKVTIGPGAWIGAGAIIMADVAAHAVVAAGAVVVKPVPERVKVAGVPAKPLNP